MKSIGESNLSGKQDIENVQEFISSSDDGFFMSHSLFPFPVVVGAKYIGVEDSAYGHLPEDAA